MDRRTAVGIAHDLSLAAWFGGACMGALGLNGATIEVDDHTQRTRVANAGWFRWAPVAGTALVTNLVTALALDRLPRSPRRADLLGGVRLGVTTGAVIATAATGVFGRQVVSAGDVPVATAVTPIEDTPDEIARAQRVLRTAQWFVPALTGALWIVNGLQQRHDD